MKRRKGRERKLPRGSRRRTKIRKGKGKRRERGRDTRRKGREGGKRGTGQTSIGR